MKRFNNKNIETPAEAGVHGCRSSTAFRNGEAEYYIGSCNDTTIPLLRFLKPGFRHCFALIRQENLWISYDPISPCTELRILPLPGDYNLVRWMEDQGITMVKTNKNNNPTECAPPGFFTCVEAVKRLLGIHRLRIQTPGQLYRYLVKESRLNHEAH